MMRPAASQAASPEPIAIEIEKTARQAVTTSSLPPSTFLTSGGSSDSATAPTSQNQLVTIAPHQMRRSSRRWLMQIARSKRRCCGRMTRSGAASPVGGMNRLATQHSEREHDHQQRRTTPDRRRPWRRGRRRSVPSRMAMKVAPSTSALPAGSSERCEMVGQDAVFDRAEQRADHAEQEQRDEQDRTPNAAQSRAPRRTRRRSRRA